MGSPRHRGCCGIPASVSPAHPPQIAYTPQRLRGGAMLLADLSSNVLRQYPKWPTSNPGVVRRMQIPEESDAPAPKAAEPEAGDAKASERKASERKASESKRNGLNRHRRLVSAESDALTLTQRTPREQRFLNRELSRIDFNDPVLALAE